MSKPRQSLIPAEQIEHSIVLIRGQRVMLDRELAALYGVPTMVLNQAVRRNIARFPDDFMFQLTKEELENWKSQFVTSNSAARMSLRKLPLAFTTRHRHAFQRVEQRASHCGQHRDHADVRAAAAVADLEQGFGQTAR